MGVYVVVNGDGAEDGGIAAVHAIADEFIARFASGEPAGNGEAGSGATGRHEPHTVAMRLAGTYRATRISHSDFTELLAAMATDVSVEANDDGTLTTTGLTDPSGRSKRHWVPIGDRLFREQGGPHLIAFSERALFYGDDPAMAYERLSWFQLPSLHLAVAAAGLLLLASSITWPVATMVRKLRGTTMPSPAGPRAARLLALATLALIIGFTAGLALLASDFQHLVTVIVTGAPALRWLFTPLRLAALGAITLAICAGLAWHGGWWSRRARLHYTAVAAGAATFITVAHLYQFVLDPMG